MPQHRLYTFRSAILFGAVAALVHVAAGSGSSASWASGAAQVLATLLVAVAIGQRVFDLYDERDTVPRPEANATRLLILVVVLAQTLSVVQAGKRETHSAVSAGRS